MTTLVTPTTEADPGQGVALRVLLVVLTGATLLSTVFDALDDGVSFDLLFTARVSWWVALLASWILLVRRRQTAALVLVFCSVVALAAYVAVLIGNVWAEPFVLLLVLMVAFGLEAGSRVALVSGLVIALVILALMGLLAVDVVEGQAVTVDASLGSGVFFALSTMMIAVLLFYGLRGYERLVRRVGEMNTAIRGSQAQLEAILRSAPVGVVTVELDGHIARVDGALAGLIDTSAATVSALVSPPYRRTVKRQLAQTCSGENSPPLEVGIRRADGGELFCRVRFGLVDRGSERDQVVLTIEDVTEQRRVEEALRSDQRHHDMGLIAGLVAHDFDNLMSAVLANATVATARAGRGLSTLDQLENVKIGARTAAMLTRQLVTYAGNTPVEKEWVDLGEVVESTRELFAATLPTGVDLQTIRDNNAGPVFADLGQMQQVVMNLILNAAAAMGDKMGTVTLSTTEIHLGPESMADWTIGGNELHPGTYACTEVVDEGCGMGPDTLARMWDPFFTTGHEGTGLGLSVVLGTVRSHQGALRVSTEPGRGTSVAFAVPTGQSGADRTV